MKLFLTLVGMAMAFAIGYKLEPNFRPILVGAETVAPDPAPAPTPDTEPATTPANVPVITPPAAPAPAIDPAALASMQLPATVLLKQDIEVSEGTSDLKMTVNAGYRVNLIRLQGDQLLVRPGELPMEGLVPIAGTDLLEQLAANPPATPAAEPQPEPDPQPATDPLTETDPEPTTEPEPDPEPEPVEQPTGPVDVVALMKASVEAGDIQEFQLAQVQGWKETGEEQIEGVTYQTGLAAYRAETIFGVKNVEAKALIRNGKVERWIWPKSGLEIK